MNATAKRLLAYLLLLLLLYACLRAIGVPHTNDAYGVAICLYLLMAGRHFLRRNRQMLRWVMISGGMFFAGQLLDWLDEFVSLPDFSDFMDDFLRSTAMLLMGWALFDLMKKQESLRHALEQEIALSRRMRHEAEYLAFHDELTTLGNRRALFRELARQHQEGQSGLLCYIDLNDFKLLNDSRGHEAGDEALCEIARALQWVSPHAYRLGGDEFVLLLDDKETKQVIYDDILRLTANLQPRFGISPCIGSTRYRPEELAQPDLVLARADASMYREKEAHRRLRRSNR